MLVRSHAREPQMLDLLDRILDKGIVIDVWAQLILAGIDLGLRFEVRMVVASIETYLKHAEPIKYAGPIAPLREI
jgi:hypothetical protein